MKQNWKYLIFGSLLVILLAAGIVGSSFAGSGQDESALTLEVDTTEESELRGNAWIGKESGLPLMVVGVNHAVDPGTPIEMAGQYLREAGGYLGLESASLNNLEHSFTHSGPSGYTVRFDQFYAGIPVYKGEIAVHLNNEETVTLVTNNYKPSAVVEKVKPAISSKEAQEIAYEYLDVQGPIRYESAELVLFPGKTDNRLAFQVIVLAASPSGDWEVLVDAHSGEIFKAADIALYADPVNDPAPDTKLEELLVDGTGNVFAPDPLSSAGAVYGDPGFDDNGDADSAQLTGELSAVVLPDIQFSGGIYTLIGPWAQIVDVEDPFKGLFPQATSAFTYTRSNDAFEAANGYYHIDRSMRYVNNTLGVSVTPFQYVGGVKFDPHGFSGADNSRYSSIAGDLAFGEGGVDDAEDADVLIHELGHGLHDWLTGGNLSQVNGLSEGFGDYWAQSYSRAYGQWILSDPEYDWVFSWDGHNEFWDGRVTDYFGVYPGDLVGQIHTDGQIWATCNMNIWDTLGQIPSDTAHLEGLAMTGPTANQEQAANAVLQAAVDAGFSPPDLVTMRSLFETCGYTMAPLPISDFGLDATPASQGVCIPTDAVYAVDVISLNGYNQSVTLSTQGEPAGTTTSFSNNPVTPTGTSTLTVGNMGAASAGSYNIDIIGIAPTSTHTITVGLDVAGGVPGTVALNTPANGATGVAPEPSFTWSSTSGADEYLLEVSSDSGFSTVVYSATETTTAHTIPAGSGLNTDTQYYWRVTAQNGCGAGTASGTFNFTTANLTCQTPLASIPDDDPIGVSSTLSLGSVGTILDLDLYVNVPHTWVGDLAFTLEHQDTGTTVTAIDRPGVPATGFGCQGNDYDATIDDEASTGVEDECGAGTPAIQGSFIGGDPTNSNLMAAFDGEDISGDWILTVTDNAGGDLGTLQEWCLVPTVETPNTLYLPVVLKQ